MVSTNHLSRSRHGAALRLCVVVESGPVGAEFNGADRVRGCLRRGRTAAPQTSMTLSSRRGGGGLVELCTRFLRPRIEFRMKLTTLTISAPKNADQKPSTVK